MWTIEPLIPMGLWWALAGLCVAAIVIYVLRRDWSVSRRQRALVTSLAVLGLTGPLLAALNPVHIKPIERAGGKPKLTVLVDATSSMTVEDEGDDGTMSRWDRGLELAGWVNSTNEVNVEKQFFSIDDPQALSETDDSGSISDPQHGHQTDLATALASVIRTGSPLGHGVVLLSDGAHNSGSSQEVLSKAAEANSLATPIYTVTLGSEVGATNLSLASRSPRMIAFPDQDLILQARLSHAGLAGQSTNIQLVTDSEVIDQQTIRLTEETSQTVRFTIPGGPKQSLQRFRLIASGVPGEATDSDNETAILVQRLDSPIEVLFLEGKPYWDSKFLARNLSRDPMVRMTSIVRLAADRFLLRRVGSETGDGPSLSPDSSPSADATSDSDSDDETEQTTAEPSDWQLQRELASPLEQMDLLKRFRMVVLGRDADRFLTPQGIENLRLWISSSGGCLVCARGAPSNEIAAQLAEILPVRWVGDAPTRFRARVSREGRDTAMFDPLLNEGEDVLSSLPSLASGAVPTSRRGLPQVLIQSVADGDGNVVPVVTAQRYGSGQSIVVEGAGMWRWAFLPPEHAEKDAVYWSLWQSLITWVISSQDFLPGQQIAIRPDRTTFLAGDRVTASLLVRETEDQVNTDGELQLSVLLESEEQELPQRFQPSVSGLQQDYYRVDFGELNVGLHAARIVRGDSETVLAETLIEVRDPWFENLEVDARHDLMRDISKQSGGKVIPTDEMDSLVDIFQEHLQTNQNDRVERTTLWDHPLALILILGTWLSAWIVRRRYGLI